MEEAVATEKDILVTRGQEYERGVSETDSKNTAAKGQHKIKKLRKQNNFFLCKDHYTDPASTWQEDTHGSCSECLKYTLRELLPNGHLPNGLEVLEYLITLKSENAGRQTNNILLVAQDLCLHWIFCNVYPKDIRTVECGVKTMSELYDSLKKRAKSNKSNAYWEKYDEFAKKQRQLFDIVAGKDSREAQEKAWNLKMCPNDWTFYNMQKETPRRGFCTSYSDRKWELSAKRKAKRESRSRVERYDDSFFSNCGTTGDGMDDCDDLGNEESFVPPDEKRSKFDFVPVSEDPEDPLPREYRYIRMGLRSVKPAYYKLIEKFISVWHMSYEQAEAAVRETANDLFDREKYGKWKSFHPDFPVDSNTLPQRKNVRENSKLFEVMALNLLVEDIMKGSECVVYSHDGSSMNGVGGYVVQSMTINGVGRTLPVFGIFTESKESLKHLQIATLEILSIASKGKYTKEDILSRISFVVSDSTAHNLGVIEAVCEELKVEKVPATLLCNVHPLMMFDRKVRELCQQIHNGIGGDRLSKCFLVDVDFRNESFPIKAIKCLSNFVCKDFSSKPWNYSTHFGEFINPKENVTLSLKDSRFNRLPECCLRLLYLIDDIEAYLQKFSDILNNVAIIDRAFVKMEILKPIFASIAILGYHVTKPFHHLLMNKDTNYSVLITSFTKLYEELTSIEAAKLLTIDQVFEFVPKEIFQESKPKRVYLIEALKETIERYPDEIRKLVRIALKMFAEGFSLQKGAIFGFGPDADKDTGTVMKISEASKETLETLDKHVDVHNIREERNVGSFNYALTVRRGSRNLESASRHIVVKSSADMLSSKTKPAEFRKFRKQVNEIEVVKAQWNEKMRKLQEQGYSEKELLNVKKEAKRLNDLTFLKGEDQPGPFTSKEDAIKFMESCEESPEKVKRMYTEVRYAKACSGLGANMAFFRLVRKGKKLSCEEYQDGLIKYFDNTKQANSVISMSAFKNVLGALEMSHVVQDSSEPASSEQEVSSAEVPSGEVPSGEVPSASFQVGDHVAVLSMDDSLYIWQLGVIEDTSPELNVSFFKRKDRKGLKWTFPDEAIVEAVENEHVICTVKNVRYECSAIITCVISEKTVTDISNRMKEMNNNEDM